MVLIIEICEKVRQDVDHSQDSAGLPLGGDSWVIATAETAVVPAPSSIVLMLTAFGSLVSYGLVCRRGNVRVLTAEGPA